MKTKKSEWFVGRWHTESSVILEISKAGKGFKVRAFDKDDNEELVVSKTIWNGKCLRFETHVPSTNYHTRNCLKLVSRNNLVQELTFWETWEKMATSIQPRKKKEVSRNKN